MTLPIANDRIIPVRKTEDTSRRANSLHYDKAVHNTTDVSKAGVGTEKSTKIPRDQVGKCDHLIASYWG